MIIRDFYKLLLAITFLVIIIFGDTSSHVIISAKPIVNSDTSKWFYNPATSHYYKSISGCDGWHACEEWAISQGGHLVTINNQEEQDWLVSTFGGEEWFWIGFNDEAVEGTWVWVSGETPTYTNWYSGEPSNSGGVEHYGLMNFALPGKWNDGWEKAFGNAIVERNDAPFKSFLPLVLKQ